jgi:hypothetical protein
MKIAGKGAQGEWRVLSPSSNVLPLGWRASPLAHGNQAVSSLKWDTRSAGSDLGRGIVGKVGVIRMRAATPGY